VSHRCFLAGLLAACLVTLAACRSDVGEPAPAGPVPAGPVPAATPSATGARAPDRSAHAPAARALTVLHRWDARRARAYRTGSVTLLRDLYVARCGAARADVRLLRTFAARGYRVRGLRMQVLTVRVLAHRPGGWRLRVTDRLERAVASGHGTRTVLPRDQASTRVLVLVRGGDGRWRVASVRAS
jgi:hypothetical protein